MKVSHSYIYIISILLFLCSDNKIVEKNIETVVISLNKMKKWDCGTASQYHDFNKSYMMLLWLNVNSCIECSMIQHDNYEEFAEIKGLRLTTVISVSKKYEERLKYYLKSLRCNTAIFIDFYSTFANDNNSISKLNPGVYLLDNNNHILIAGDPLINENIETKYDQVLGGI